MLAVLLLSIVQLCQAASLTGLLESTNTLARRGTAEDYKVSDLPGLDKVDKSLIPDMYAGYVEIDSSNDIEYFFWKFETNQTSNDKLVFWYNGGPGCSSMDGALLESGPFRPVSDTELKYNEGTWLASADMVFVDEPAGTGFSKGKKYASELNEIADDMIIFFDKYFEAFPEDKEKDIYLSGESYAGQYIPYFAARALSQKKDYKLKGLLIIDGYTYPDLQDSKTFDFGLENGLVTQEQVDSAKSDVESCLSAIKDNEKSRAEIYKTMQETGEYTGGDNGDSNNKVSTSECSSIFNNFLDVTNNDEGCLNMYDYRLRDNSCGGSGWPVEEKYMEPYFNTAESALHIGSKISWTECSDPAYENLKNTKSYPAFFKLPYILDHIQIMLMVGRNDIICNYAGIEAMVSELTWKGASEPGFSNSTEFKDLSVSGGKSYGKAKFERDLWLLEINEASHMVPYNQPAGSRAGLDILFGDYQETSKGYAAVSHGKL